ncbi:hypothetical protein TNCV_486281 [Trichonephila clavipes]|nr:hypothetical protein TNCV_486281 [Trichonephila clavipes]
MLKFERDRSIRFAEAGWKNPRIARYLSRSNTRRRRLDDAGKSLPTKPDDRQTAIELGPQMSGKTERLSE